MGAASQPAAAELQAWCREWQERLRLQDWEIVVSYARAREFERGAACGGDVSWLAEKKTARIRVLDPGDRMPEPLAPYDEELVIVHELLHLHLAEWPADEGRASLAEEQAVHALSSALVRMKRERAK